VLLVFYAALVVGVYLLVKRAFGRPETPNEREFRSRVAASFGSALPKVYGAQSSADLPEPDMRDEIAPAGANVLVLEPKVKPTHHPFRDVDDSAAGDGSAIVEEQPSKGGG
jgi:hypothetical protein